MEKLSYEFNGNCCCSFLTRHCLQQQDSNDNNRHFERFSRAERERNSERHDELYGILQNSTIVWLFEARKNILTVRAKWFFFDIVCVFRVDCLREQVNCLLSADEPSTATTNRSHLNWATAKTTTTTIHARSSPSTANEAILAQNIKHNIMAIVVMIIGHWSCFFFLFSYLLL